MLFMAFFSAYQVTQTFCEQNEPLKQSLNIFCGEKYFKHVIDGKLDMKLSDKAREKNSFKEKSFWTLFIFPKLCVSFIRSPVLL